MPSKKILFKKKSKKGNKRNKSNKRNLRNPKKKYRRNSRKKIKQNGGNDKCLNAFIALTKDFTSSRKDLIGKFKSYSGIRNKLIESSDKYIKTLSSDKKIKDHKLENKYNKQLLENYFSCLTKNEEDLKNYFYYEL